ncbi:BQ5605_C007g04723 [Microbotryum silenes-dioicae]|uniref:BQ5605_C007g04723 protein n=1 Tax=Microbotryum silenes-dioicae TaxID=796604 RepID=A0A2X0P9W4_9BASI|nr:BQ5605_C007g04723 [Microbotryum silenes-dioicae]
MCDSKQCRILANAESTCTDASTCDSASNAGFKNVDCACVCHVAQCLLATNASESGACNFTFNAGFKNVNGACVQCGMLRNARRSPVTNAASICTASGTCDITYNPKIRKVT